MIPLPSDGSFRLGSAAVRRYAAAAAAAELYTQNVQRTNNFTNQSPLNLIKMTFQFSGGGDGFDLEWVSVSVAADVRAPVFNCDPLH